MAWVPRLDLQRLELWGLDTGAATRRAVRRRGRAASGRVLPAARRAATGARGRDGSGRGRRHTTHSGMVVACDPHHGDVLRVEPVRRRAPRAGPVAATHRLRRPAMAHLRPCATDDGPNWGTATVALAATAMSPAGGLIGLVVGLSIGMGGRRAFRLLTLTAVLVNAPWIAAERPACLRRRHGSGLVPRLRHASGRSCSGRWGAVLSLGGNPGTATWYPTPGGSGRHCVLVLVMGAIMLVGLVALARENRGFLIALAVPAGARPRHGGRRYAACPTSSGGRVGRRPRSVDC